MNAKNNSQVKPKRKLFTKSPTLKKKTDSPKKIKMAL